MAASQMSVLSLSLLLSDVELYIHHTLGLNRRTSSTTPILTLPPSGSKMNPHTPKSDLQ